MGIAALFGEGQASSPSWSSDLVCSSHTVLLLRLPAASTSAANQESTECERFVKSIDGLCTPPLQHCKKSCSRIHALLQCSASQAPYAAQRWLRLTQNCLSSVSSGLINLRTLVFRPNVQHRSKPYAYLNASGQPTPTWKRGRGYTIFAPAMLEHRYFPGSTLCPSILPVTVSRLGRLPCGLWVWV